MSKVFIEDTEMQDIAKAIREKNGTDIKYLPSEMGGAIRSIVSNYQNLRLSEIVIDVDAVNGEQVTRYFETLMDRTKDISIFVNKKILKKDSSLFVNNEVVLFAFNPLSAQIAYNNICCRYRNGLLDMAGGTSNIYDMVLNIGDEYYLIEMTSEGDNA